MSKELEICILKDQPDGFNVIHIPELGLKTCAKPNEKDRLLATTEMILAFCISLQENDENIENYLNSIKKGYVTRIIENRLKESMKDIDPDIKKIVDNNFDKLL